MYHFYDSYIEGTGENAHWVHEVTNKAEFKNIIAHLNRNDFESENAVDEFRNGTVSAPLRNEGTIYLVKKNIDFGGLLWTEDSESKNLIKDTIFTGVLLGDTNGVNRVVLSNIRVEETIEAFGNKGLFGLFSRSKNATFRNIELSNIVLDNPDGDGVSLLTLGYKSNENHTYTFENVKIDSTCSIDSSTDNIGAFLAFGRYAKTVSFINCENDANISATGNCAGGFMGSGSNNAPSGSTFTMTNCINRGNIKNNSQVGGFFGYAGGSSGRTYTLKDCKNYGNIQSSDNQIGPFFATTSATTVTHSTYGNCSNYGKFIVNKTIYGNHSFSSDSTEMTANDNYSISHIVLDENEEVVQTITNINDDFYANFLVKGPEIISLEFSNHDLSYKNALSSEVTSEATRIEVSIAIAAGPAEIATGKAYASKIGRTPIKSYNFGANLESINSVKEVTQVGYFKPSADIATATSVEYPTVPGYDYDYYLLDYSLVNNPDYAEGYTISGETAHIIIKNEGATETYTALVHFRCFVRYTVNIYGKNDALIATGYVENGWVSGVNPDNLSTFTKYAV